MDDFQRFHQKAFILLMIGFLLILLGCAAAEAAGLWWIAMLLLPGGCFGMRIAYNIQFRRFNDRHGKNAWRDPWDVPPRPGDRH